MVAKPETAGPPASWAVTDDSEQGPKRPAHRPSRSPEIVDAAIRVFSQKGLTGTTMADIAEECGMSPGALYYHFGNKEELLAEAVRSAAAEVAILTGEGGEPPGTLREIVRNAFNWQRAHPDRARLLFVAAPASPSPEIADVWAAFVESHVDGLHRYFPNSLPPGRRPRSGTRRAERDLAARTAIGTASAAAMAFLAGDGVFGRRVSAESLADAITAVMQRLMEVDAR